MRTAPSPRAPLTRSWRHAPLWLRIAAICAAILLISTGSTTFALLRVQKVYGGRVDILYLPAADTPLDARQRILATQQEIARSRAVLGPLARAEGTSYAELRDAVTVDSGVDDLLHITVGDPARSRAVGLAQAVSTRYVDVARSFANGSEQRSRALDRQIGDAVDELRGAPAADAPALRERLRRLEDAQVQLQVNAAGDTSIRPLGPAYALGAPLSPRPLRAAALGLLWGLAVATGVALVLTRRRRASP
jgi:capsular polysaccharide biosynthesis protein